jgi:periplasmic protein TonB
MVLTQRHPHAQTASLQQAIAGIQPVRVLGMAGAIALNVAAFMLLMVPVSAPMQMTFLEEVTPLVPLDPPKPKPPEPETVPVTQPQPRTETPVRITPPTPQPMPDQNVIVPDGSEYVPPTNADPLPDVGPALPVNPDPQPSTRLEYASAPAPAYPREALLDGKEGTVVLRVLVDVDGKPLSVDIERSSGHRKLDEAARRQVLRKWIFARCRSTASCR